MKVTDRKIGYEALTKKDMSTFAINMLLLVNDHPLPDQQALLATRDSGKGMGSQILYFIGERERGGGVN